MILAAVTDASSWPPPRNTASRRSAWILTRQRIKESIENVRTNNVAHLVTIKQADIFELDFHEATVVTLYLLPELNVRLMPKLAKLKPGSRIISDDFDMKGAKPKEVVHLDQSRDDDNGESQSTLYKWVVPWEPE